MFWCMYFLGGFIWYFLLNVDKWNLTYFIGFGPLYYLTVILARIKWFGKNKTLVSKWSVVKKQRWSEPLEQKSSYIIGNLIITVMCDTKSGQMCEAHMTASVWEAGGGWWRWKMGCRLSFVSGYWMCQPVCAGQTMDYAALIHLHQTHAHVH